MSDELAFVNCNRMSFMSMHENARKCAKYLLWLEQLDVTSRLKKGRPKLSDK